MIALCVETVLRAIVALETCPKTGKLHLQAYVELANAKTISAFKKAFDMPKAHLEPRMGTPFEAWTYCEMECAPFLIHGSPPSETASTTGRRTVWDDIKSRIDAGACEMEILHEFPSSYARYSTGIAKMIHLRDLSTKMNHWREVSVTYMSGPTGCGKTRSVLEIFENPADVYRITNYANPFDGYRGQSIVLFEEFRSSLPFEQMLVYLDGYYCALPCRYADKMSLWDQVFLVSNIGLSSQYLTVQERHPESWEAFLRRIDTVNIVAADGSHQSTADRVSAVSSVDLHDYTE